MTNRPDFIHVNFLDDITVAVLIFISIYAVVTRILSGVWADTPDSLTND